MSGNNFPDKVEDAISNAAPIKFRIDIFIFWRKIYIKCGLFLKQDD